MLKKLYECSRHFMIVCLQPTWGWHWLWFVHLWLSKRLNGLWNGSISYYLLLLLVLDTNHNFMMLWCIFIDLCILCSMIMNKYIPLIIFNICKGLFLKSILRFTYNFLRLGESFYQIWTLSFWYKRVGWVVQP